MYALPFDSSSGTGFSLPGRASSLATGLGGPGGPPAGTGSGKGVEAMARSSHGCLTGCLVCPWFDSAGRHWRKCLYMWGNDVL